jgi:hypothetical protein
MIVAFVSAAAMQSLDLALNTLIQRVRTEMLRSDAEADRNYFDRVSHYTRSARGGTPPTVDPPGGPPGEEPGFPPGLPHLRLDTPPATLQGGGVDSEVMGLSEGVPGDSRGGVGGGNPGVGLRDDAGREPAVDGGGVGVDLEMEAGPERVSENAAPGEEELGNGGEGDTAAGDQEEGPAPSTRGGEEGGGVGVDVEMEAGSEGVTENAAPGEHGVGNRGEGEAEAGAREGDPGPSTGGGEEGLGFRVDTEMGAGQEGAPANPPGDGEGRRRDGDEVEGVGQDARPHLVLDLNRISPLDRAESEGVVGGDREMMRQAGAPDLARFARWDQMVSDSEESQGDDDSVRRRLASRNHLKKVSLAHLIS